MTTIANGKIAWGTDLTVITCGACGMPFAVPEHWRNARQKDRSTFYCPNGHPRAFIQTREQELQDELARQKHRTEQAEAEARYQRGLVEHNVRRVRAMRGQMTKARKRTAKGTCPCCSFTFPDLAMHMKAQHPLYANGDPEKASP